METIAELPGCFPEKIAASVNKSLRKEARREAVFFVILMHSDFATDLHTAAWNFGVCGRGDRDWTPLAA
jgi:hypothetical protein